MKVKTLVFNFTCEEFMKGMGDKLRGYFANKFGKYDLIHHHLSDNRFLYKSPLVQYKILDGKPLVLGINEGAEVLQKIHEDIDYLKIGHTEYPIREKTIVFKTDNYGEIDSAVKYFFLTPWLALNEKNYEKYQRLGSWAKKKNSWRRFL